MLSKKSIAIGFFCHHQLIQRGAVQILPDKEYLAEKYGEMPSDEEIEKRMKDIISEVNDKLPTFKIIRDVIVRKEDFIRTTTRKIKRAANI